METSYGAHTFARVVIGRLLVGVLTVDAELEETE